MLDFLLTHPEAGIGGLLGLGVSAMAALVALARRRHRREVAATTAFADARGLTLVLDDPAWAETLATPPFTLGRRHRATFVLQGTVGGRAAMAMQFRYVTTGQDAQGNPSDDTHHVAAWALALPSPLPPVLLTPENVLTRVARVFGSDDVHLESEDFNRRYRVSAQDRRLAYDLLPPRSMQLLLSGEKIGLSTDGQWLVGWQVGAQDVGRLDERWALLGRLLDNVPRFVWTDRAPPAFDRLLQDELDRPKDQA